MADFREYAFVSLGANLGSRFGGPAQTLLAAIDRLRALSGEPLLVSSLWSSSPVDCPPDSPDYHNALVALLPRDNDTPLALLRQLQAIEREFGRVRMGLRNEARVLDLDLIAFGDERSDTAELMLPHPRARERLFVLKPLAEIAPRYRFPGDERTLESLMALIKDQEARRVGEL